MPKGRYYEEGSNNGVCDQCGRIFKFTDLRKRWDGAYVDAACFEIRQPQDFVRAVRDNPSVPVSRPFTFIVLGDDAKDPGALGSPYLGEYSLGGP
jgi:hypothetical protein